MMSLRRREAEEISEVVWDAVERERGWQGFESVRIASQALLPGQAGMGTLRTREDHRLAGGRRLGSRLHLHVHPLSAHELDAGAPLLSARPVSPEQGSGATLAGMEQHAHAARLCRLGAVPLTLLAQRTRAAVKQTGRIHQPQAAISFSALLLGRKQLARRTAHCPVRLKGEVLAREASGLPAPTDHRRAVALLLMTLGGSRSKRETVRIGVGVS